MHQPPIRHNPKIHLVAFLITTTWFYITWQCDLQSVAATILKNVVILVTKGDRTPQKVAPTLIAEALHVTKLDIRAIDKCSVA